jgi:hypothetical protein
MVKFNHVLVAAEVTRLKSETLLGAPASLPARRDSLQPVNKRSTAVKSHCSSVHIRAHPCT